MIPKPARAVLALLWALFVLVSTLAALVILTDDGWDLAAVAQTNGPLALWVLLAPLAVTVALLIWMRTTSRLHTFLNWIGVPVLNCYLIQDDEAHGRTSAD